MLQFMTRLVERSQNKVVIRPPYAVPLEAFTLHQSLFVVDLHADALLWNRSLLERSRIGHVDIPRLLAGNVGLQVFGVVTKSPLRQNYYRTASRGDQITALAVASRWPLRTWGSLFQRALYQANKLENLAANSKGKLVLVRSVRDLNDLILRCANREEVVGGFASLEGVHALQGKLDRLDVLYQAGFRMIGMTHFFDNDAGGSAHGTRKGGLTDFGRNVVRRIQENHMVLDLAHASPKLIDDILNLSSTPVVASHSGVRGTFDNPRNLSDEHVRRIAGGGGVIGVSLFKGALAESRLDLTVQAMRYVANLAGIEAVALGSDFDGLVKTPVDASGLALLTDALLREGFSAEEIGKIMGGNAVRVLRAILPQD